MGEGVYVAPRRAPADHADLATTMGYTHLVDGDLLALLERAEDEDIQKLAEGV